MKTQATIAENANALDTQSVQTHFPCGSQLAQWYSTWIQTVNIKKETAKVFNLASFLNKIRENVSNKITLTLKRLIRQIVLLVKRVPAFIADTVENTALIIKRIFANSILLAKQLNTQIA